MKLFILWHYRLGVKSEKFSGLPLRTLIELKPLAKTLYSLKLNNNGFQSIPNLLQGNTTFDKLRSLDISHNPIKGKLQMIYTYFPNIAIFFEIFINFVISVLYKIQMLNLKLLLIAIKLLLIDIIEIKRYPKRTLLTLISNYL